MRDHIRLIVSEMKDLIRNITIILFLIVANYTYGNDFHYYFRNLNTKDGLSENSINCIFQDQKGFIWIGTNGGLNRYDGYEFKIYTFDPKEGMDLRSNIIQGITEDHDGNLWLRTADRGIYKLDINTETFSSIRKSCPDGEVLQSNFLGRGIVDNENRVWYSGDEGINIIIPGEQDAPYEIIKIPISEGDRPGELNHIPYVLSSDKFNRVWIGSQNGLYMASENPLKKNEFAIKYYPEITTRRITNIEIFENNVLLSIVGGVIRAKVNEINELVSFKTVCNDYLHVMHLDNSGNLWGAYKDGLKYYEFNEEKDEFVHMQTFRSDIMDAGTISEDIVTVIEEDNTGVIWIGTNISGVSILDPYRKKFNYYLNIAGTGSSSENQIRSLYEDSKRNLWLGTEGSGIVLVPEPERDALDNVVQDYLTIQGEGYNFIYSFAEGTIKGKSHIWIGTGYPFKLGYVPLRDDMRGALQAEQLEDFPVSIFDLHVDRDNIVWACSYSDGIYRIYPDRDEVIQWDNISANQDGSGLSSPIARSVIEDQEGNIWVGTSSGLDLIQESEKLKANPDIISFKHIPDNPNNLSHDYILPMILGQDGSLWIGTMGGGVNRMQKNREGWYDFTWITSHDGLPDNMIKGLLEDYHGNIWISSNQGISRYNIETGEIRNYGINDGLRDYEFMDLSCLKTREGEFFFGSVNGLNSFFPDEIADNTQKAIPVFTELQVLNKAVGINEELNGRIVLDKTISSTGELTLLHAESSFSIKFSALHYASPAKNNFKYKLEGFDKDWISTNGDNRIAKYTNLNPGHYTFKLLASNNDLHWNNEPAVLEIFIKPPYWRSKMAFVIYVILFIVGLIFFRKFSLISVQKKNSLLMEKFAKQQLEEVTRSKLDFFTHISHEIRTPLSLIDGPVRNLINDEQELSEEKKKKLYRLIEKNSNRIQGLITQLLDFRKAELGKLKIKVHNIDVIGFSRSILNNYQEWSARKEHILEFRAGGNNLMGWIDPDVYEKILDNLITNAIKYTPNGGRILLEINTTDRDNVEVRLVDSGTGISKEQIPHIFDMFYRTDQNKISEGTGIGLSFVKTLVQLHHGRIRCESQPEVGTSFIFTIPISMNSYSEQEIDHGPLKHIQPEGVKIENGDEVMHLQKTHRKSKGDEVKLLIVEDSEEIVDFISENLPSRYIVDSAPNGEAGLKKTIEKSPDIIISDILMPVMDGIEFCSNVKENQDICHIPLILLSSKTEAEDQCMGFSSGADAYIGKPFNIDVLVSNIDAILWNRKILRDKFTRQIYISPAEITVNNHDELLIESLVQQIEENISNSDYRVEDLAHNVGKSVSQLNNKLKAITGLTIGNFIKSVRLKRAAQLLEKSDFTISEITFEVGFNDLKYFRNCFRKEFGLTPSRYRIKNAAKRKKLVKEYF